METYWRWMAKATCRVRRVLAREDGQGTTEYAILVGVLVVIAIIRSMVKDKKQGFCPAF